MWLKDGEGKDSVTTTILIGVVGVALFKLVVAGMTFGSFKMGDFSGSDFSLVFGAAAALYFGRRNISIGQNNQPSKEE